MKKPYRNIKRKGTKLFHIMLVLMLIISMMTLPSVLLNRPVSAEWWNNSWQYKRSIAITNPFLKYQMQIVIGKDNISGITASCSNHCQDDFSDIRFVSGDMNPLPYWRQNYTSGVRATFWVNNTYNDSSIFMYYGNPTAAYAGDGNTTFDFFDDFNGTALNTHKWITNGNPTMTFSNSAMTMVTNAAGDYIYHPVKFGKCTQIYSKIKFVNTYRGASIGYDLYGNPNTEPMMCIETNGATIMDTDWADGSHYTEQNNFNLQYTYFFNYLQRGVNSIWFYNNATLITNTSTYIPSQSMNATIGYKNYGNPNGCIVVDFLAVMKFRDYTQHPPTWGSIGSQQTYGGSAPINQNPSPSDGAINVNLNPSLSITLVSPKGYLMDIHFKTNASGTWQTIASRHNVGNGTYTNTTTTFTNYNVKYWWKVSTNNTLHEWSNTTYTFTTTSITTSVNAITPYNVSTPITITATGPSDLTNVSLWYRYSPDNTSWNNASKGVTWKLASNHYDGDGTFNNINYINKAVVKNANHYGSISPANKIFAYTVSVGDNCLTIIDCTKQWAPTEFNTYTISDSPHDVYVMDYPSIGRVAFVLSFYSGNLVAMNVTNPGSMSTLGSIDVMTGYGMYLDVDEIHHILYETEWGDTSYLHAIDVSDPSNPREICSVEIPRSNPWTPHVDDNTLNYVYVAGQDENSSVSIFNVTWVHNITNPQMVYIKTQGFGSYADLVQNGNYLYGDSEFDFEDSKDWAIHTWDISDPTNLTDVSITPLNTYNHFSLWKAPNGNDYLITRHYTSADGDMGVNIVDDSNKSSPMNVGYIPYIAGVQQLNRCDWNQVHYNNITGKQVLYVVGYYENSWVAFNLSLNTSVGGWRKFSTDFSYPWSWSFTFPNGTGYYEFYSIGQKTGSIPESAPLTCDALCHYLPGQNYPHDPYPANDSIGVPLNTILSWNGGSVNNPTYDVYFGTSTTPPKVSSNQTATTYNPGQLTLGTKYYWRIVEWINVSNRTVGALWNFKTDSAPYVPSNPSPANHATGVALNPVLSWNGGDPDPDDSVTYDVFFGVSTPPTKVVSNQSQMTYTPGTLYYGTKYYWKIVAWDSHGVSTSSPVWDFKTNSLPNIPSNPNPTDHATAVVVNPVLSWTGGDPDPGDTVTYDVFFDVITPPSKVIGNQSATTFTPETLTYGTTYYWKIVAWDNHGATAAGSVWSFKTDFLPNVPINPNPADNATEISVNTNLSWTGGDPDHGDTVTYDVFFGTTSQPPKVASNQSGTTYNPGTLNYGTTYYWRIVSWDNHGASAQGSLWRFTTHINTPPSAPVINGPLTGKPGRTYVYTFVAVDQQGDNISYEINWGDGTVDPWYGPVPSNVIITRSHTWKSKGTYTIQARAKDIHGAVGEWGTLIVTMPLSNQFQHIGPFLQFLQQLLERFPHAFPILRHLLGY